MTDKITARVTIREGNILPLPDFLGFDVGDVIEFVLSEAGDSAALVRVEGTISDEDIEKHEMWSRVEKLDD